jgi:hypothetical protein
MNRAVLKLLVLASALVLGACSADSDITAPSAPQIDVQHDVQIDRNDGVQPEVARTGRKKRYAMAAS